MSAPAPHPNGKAFPTPGRPRHGVKASQIEDERMTGKKTVAKTETKTDVADAPDDREGRLKSIGGSQSDHWNDTLANQAAQALWLKNSTPMERDKQLSATVAALMGIAPKDELEGMMAAQLIAAHNARWNAI